MSFAARMTRGASPQTGTLYNMGGMVTTEAFDASATRVALKFQANGQITGVGSNPPPGLAWPQPSTSVFASTVDNNYADPKFIEETGEEVGVGWWVRFIANETYAPPADGAALNTWHAITLDGATVALNRGNEEYLHAEGFAQFSKDGGATIAGTMNLRFTVRIA